MEPTTPPQARNRPFIRLELLTAMAGLLPLLAIVLRPILEQYRRRDLINLFIVILLGILVMAFTRHISSPGPEADGYINRRRKGQAVFLIATLIAYTLYVFNEIIGPMYSKPIVSADVTTLVHGRSWISYDPSKFNPYNKEEPTAESIKEELSWIKQELEWIRRAHYGGVITFSSHDTRMAIPRLAKHEGLSVIMGVWDPSDNVEVTRALSQRRYVDAYAVGHNGLNERYSYSQLAQAIEHIRFRTKRPVSTTEPIAAYLADPRLLTIGDWLFPDAHVSVTSATRDEQRQFIADPSRDARRILDRVDQLVAATRGHSPEPILLKMISYPVAGIPNASPRAQAEFYITLLESKRDGDLAPGVSLSVNSTFDQPWKAVGWPFYPWDPYTGLFEAGGRPRPATVEITNRLPLNRLPRDKATG